LVVHPANPAVIGEAIHGKKLYRGPRVNAIDKQGRKMWRFSQLKASWQSIWSYHHFGSVKTRGHQKPTTPFFVFEKNEVL
jgi:hypothetical protein